MLEQYWFQYEVHPFYVASETRYLQIENRVSSSCIFLTSFSECAWFSDVVLNEPS